MEGGGGDEKRRRRRIYRLVPPLAVAGENQFGRPYTIRIRRLTFRDIVAGGHQTFRQPDCLSRTDRQADGLLLYC